MTIVESWMGAEFEIECGAGWCCLVGESWWRWVVRLILRKLFALGVENGGT